MSYTWGTDSFLNFYVLNSVLSDTWESRLPDNYNKEKME